MPDRSEGSKEDNASQGFVAFRGAVCLARGGLAEVALAVRQAQLQDPAMSVIVIDRETGKVADLDLRGTARDVAARYMPRTPPAAARGRPKLGVLAREVTLLPRHWEWLARQPGGASVTLRGLVETARKADGGATKARERIEAAYRFMSAVAADLPGFEESARAIFAGDPGGLAAAIAQWPPDIRSEVSWLLDDASSQGAAP